MSKAGDLKKLLKRLEAQGFTVTEKTNGYLIKSPDGVGMVTIHRTESDQGVKKITEGRLRRIGYRD